LLSGLSSNVHKINSVKTVEEQAHVCIVWSTVNEVVARGLYTMYMKAVCT